MPNLMCWKEDEGSYAGPQSWSSGYRPVPVPAVEQRYRQPYRQCAAERGAIAETPASTRPTATITAVDAAGGAGSNVSAEAKRDAPAAEAVAAYVSDMCRDLAGLATSADLSFLAYLLEIAREEALIRQMEAAGEVRHVGR